MVPGLVRYFTSERSLLPGFDEGITHQIPLLFIDRPMRNCLPLPVPPVHAAGNIIHIQCLIQPAPRRQVIPQAF